MDYVQDEDEEQIGEVANKMRRNQKLAGITGSKQIIEETKYGGQEEDPLQGYGQKKIIDREDEYHKGRLRRRELSPEREDAFTGRFGAQAVQEGKAEVGVKRNYQ